MMTLAQAKTAAQNTPSMSAEYRAAFDLCILRGLRPNDKPHGQLPNWQMVIAEQLLEGSLRDAMIGRT